MSERAGRNIRGAHEAAAAGRIDDWVHEFLSSGLGSNPPMATGLRKQRRWWIGPVLVPLKAFARVCGPEPEMEYWQSQESWDTQVAAIMEIEPDELPPVIAEYQGRAPLRLHDGSHRHEALRRRGATTMWTLIWCNDEADFLIAKPAYDRPGLEPVDLGAE